MEVKLFDDDFSAEEMIKLDMMYDEINALIKDVFLQEYIALYLQCLYKYDFLKAKTTNLKRHINSAINAFNNIKDKDIDLNKIKQILEEKYYLKIIKEEPYLELEEI